MRARSMGLIDWDWEDEAGGRDAGGTADIIAAFWSLLMLWARIDCGAEEG